MIGHGSNKTTGNFGTNSRAPPTKHLARFWAGGAAVLRGSDMTRYNRAAPTRASPEPHRTPLGTPLASLMHPPSCSASGVPRRPHRPHPHASGVLRSRLPTSYQVCVPAHASDDPVPNTASCRLHARRRQAPSRPTTPSTAPPACAAVPAWRSPAGCSWPHGACRAGAVHRAAAVGCDNQGWQGGRASPVSDCDCITFIIIRNQLVDNRSTNLSGATNKPLHECIVRHVPLDGALHHACAIDGWMDGFCVSTPRITGVLRWQVYTFIRWVQWWVLLCT